MAMMNWFLYPDRTGSGRKMEKLLDDCLSFLRDHGVKFVSAHVSGEDLLALHLLEDKGFRYFQTTVYPIAQCTNLPYKTDPVCVFGERPIWPISYNLPDTTSSGIGHFYCDSQFDKETVDSMYENGFRTIWNNQGRSP
jgi:hypothetical protein